MERVEDFRAEMDPYARAPAAASRIRGLGGSQPAAESGYAFQTAPLVAPPGLVAITVAFTGLSASRGTLLIEVAAIDGAECRQIGLRTVSLADLAAKGGAEQITLSRDRRGTYSVAGHIYDDTDGAAAALTIGIAVSSFKRGTDAEHRMTRVSRLAGIEPPNFEHPASQTFSREQVREAVFRSTCKSLGITPDATSWSAAFILHALRYQLGNLSGCRGFGVGPSAGLIGRALKSMGAMVVESSSFNPAEWPVGTESDFAWLDVERQPEPALHLFVKACSLIERLKIGGMLAMVFPFEHGRMPRDACDVPKRSDVEIIALKMLAGGHSVAQLKFRTMEGPLPAIARTKFGMIVHRME